MFRRINEALPGLLLGILLYGGFVQLVGVWFVADKIRYTSGLWIGIALSLGMAIHMAVVLNDAADIGAEEAARKKVAFQSILRYIAIVVIFFVTAHWKLGNLITLFIGVMGLKAGAYLQPLTHKAVLKLTGRKDKSSDSDEA